MKWEIQEPQVLGGVWGNAPTVPHRLLRRVIHHQLAQRNRQNALHDDDRSGNNAGVVPACNRQLRVFPPANVYRLLLLRNRRRRLHGNAEYDGHAVCNAARHAAAKAQGGALSLLSDYDLTGEAPSAAGTLVLGYGSLKDDACASVGETLKKVCTAAREASVTV